MNQTEASQLAEYQAAQDTYLHYDSFRWQAGSFLIAGVFVFWGFLISGTPTPSPEMVGLSGLLVSGLMSIWILFAHHYRQIYLCKLDRIRELEGKLGMEQTLRFSRYGATKKQYTIYRPKGHNLDLAMFIVTSVGGPFLGLIQSGFSKWLLPPIILTIIVFIWVLINEYRINHSLDTLSNQNQKPKAKRKAG